MKVALFTETYTPDVNGVVAHVRSLKQGLEELGHEVLVVTADKHAKHHYIQDGVLRCPSVELKKLYGFGMAMPYSRKRLKLIAGFAPDVIHIHHEFGIGWSGMLAAKNLHKPLIYTSHTSYEQYIYYIAPKPFLKAVTQVANQYEKYIATQATVLTGPSKKSEAYFKKIGVQKRVNVIPNVADLETFDPQKITVEQKKALRASLKIKPQQTIACFSGRVAQEKSVDVLLEYWASEIKKTDHLQLLILGDGPEKENLEKLAAKLKIADQVTFAGMIPHDQMPLYYAISGIFVTASLSEMNSISMLEALAMGLPALQRYDELNADQIKPEVNGNLFKNAAEFGRELKRIAGLSPAEKLTLKDQVRQTVLKRGPKDLAKYMVRVYTKAIKENKPKRQKER